MELDRRASARRPVRASFNQYIDRAPHPGEILELSTTGMLVRSARKPDGLRACYAVEIAPEPGAEPVWLCATPVWAAADLEALAFVAVSDADRRRIEALLGRLPSADRGTPTPLYADA